MVQVLLSCRNEAIREKAVDAFRKSGLQMGTFLLKNIVPQTPLNVLSNWQII